MPADRSAEHAHLAAVMAAWREAFTGRTLHRTDAGPGWVRLHLAGPQRPSLLLSVLPGANLLAGLDGPLPAPLIQVLDPRRDHPLANLLSGGRFTGCGVLAGDRVAVCFFADRKDRPLALLHQLFGPRGNLCLVNRQDQVVWAHQRPPVDLLTRYPRDEDLATGAFDPTGKLEYEHPAHAVAQLQWRLAVRRCDAWSRLLRRRLEAAERLVRGLDADLETAKRAEEFRAKAETLAANLHLVKPGQAALQTANVRDGSPMTIDLDPALGPAANLEAWFKRAAKGEKGRRIIEKRLTRARVEQRALNAAATELTDLRPGPFAEETDPGGRLAALLAWQRSRPDLILDPRPRAKAPAEAARPFRRYRLQGKWEVWIGRTNQENDELTHRASHLRDIWLHAQGVPGSHVILRTGGRPQDVPGAILAQAAALAALHSKARHSSLVPVIWTERRYVRKPRKAAPGLAVCLREQSLMVAPRIPPGAETI